MQSQTCTFSSGGSNESVFCQKEGADNTTNIWHKKHIRKMDFQTIAQKSDTTRKLAYYLVYISKIYFHGTCKFTFLLQRFKYPDVVSGCTRI